MLALENYSIGERLYQGRRFEIYKGHRESDQQKVILKVCHSALPNFMDLVALQHEYQILKQLDLSGIIHVYELIKLQDQLVLVLEDIDGLSLQQYLLQKPLDLSNFFKIATQLIDAIGELHLHQIIHKDINPSNIIINPKTLKVKLADFSISSQLLQEAQDYAALGNLEGTLAYISPEQTGRMNRAIDWRSDFYSLGVTFYEMLTGQLPFQSEDKLELIHYHLTLLPKAISTINPDIPLMVEAIISKLLSKTPEGRYQSAAGLKADLMECQLQWEKEHEIKSFILGKQEIQDHLIVSQKLYGREDQVQQLLEVFKRVNQGQTELVLISGYSGIGKTSLVREISRPIVQQHGYFISGKYDQLRRSTPYTAIIEAFSGLISICMSEPEERLKVLKKSLLGALGNNAQVIIDIIPSLELILGPQPAVLELSPVEAQNRLTMTFLNFVRVFAQAEHPLVIFLDDLQWIDTASLQLINLLLTDNDIKYFLVIGAYRDNEVSANHPLVMMQQKLKKSAVPLTNLILGSLKREDIQHLIEDSLTSSHKEIPPLANLFLEKTQGNPFFINEFIKRIYSEKLLTYSNSKRSWEWDIQAIQGLSVTDNVLDLLMTRISRLSGHAQRMLQMAACIGHTFDLQTLSIICEQDLATTAKDLLEANQANFVIPINDNYWLLESIAAKTVDEKNLLTKKINYRFIHDKVQQSAYQLIADEKKQLVHLQIGRLLLKENVLTEKDERLFEILNHFNYSLNHITDKQEKLQLAQYNLLAGRKAKISSAYQAAKDYLQAGLNLINGIDLRDKSELHNALLKELATCQYLTVDYEAAEVSLNKLLQSAKETLSTIEIFKLNCEMLATLDRHEEAIQLGLKVLASVNISIPKNPNLLHVLWAILRVKMEIGRRKIADIDFPVMESKQYKAISELISQLISSAFIINHNLFVIFACINLRLSLRHGYTESTAFTCLVYAFTIMHGLNWYEEGLQFCDLYSKLQKRFPQANFEGKNNFVLGAFIEPWRVPFEKSIEVLQKSYHYLYDAGDLVYSNYCNFMMAFDSYMLGQPFAETKTYIQNTINFIQKTKSKDFYRLGEFWNYIYACNTTNCFSMKDLVQFEEKILAHKNNTEISFFYTMAIKMCYLHGYFEEAKMFGAKYESYAKYSLGMVNSVEGKFYYALALAATVKSNKVRFVMHKLKKIRNQVARWAQWCPMNYQHYLTLLDAEIARVNHNFPLAVKCYEEAIRLAELRNAMNILAITNECAGRFFTELSSNQVAALYFKNAYHAYKNLGLITKENEYADKYPEFLSQSQIAQTLSQTTEHTDEMSIDMLSLMRSSQLISGEIELDKLLQKLLLIVLQNAGADRGLLLSKEDNKWYVEAEGTISEQRITLAHVEQIDRRSDLPLALIRYVQRTLKPILMQSSKDAETFAANDEYLTLMQPKSVLVMPIFFQGELQNIFYLENRMLELAFKKEHVQILQILSSQAAISLQNARLYYQATHDSLTGLSNRNLLYQMFNIAINKSNKTKTSLAVILIDLDLFKIVNDTLGHQVGDQFLLYIADLLRSCLRKEDLAVRLGGDEFVVMIEYNDIKEVNDVAERFLKHIKNPIEIAGHEINMTASIGISLYPNDSDDISELLNQADMALYRVKSTGKNYFQFYTSSLNHQIQQQYKDEIELRRAFENNELCLYFQPVYKAKTHEVAYFEALIRWRTQLGLLDAKHFVPIAEKSGLIIALGRWALKAALEQIKTWKTAGYEPKPVAVNVSGLQFKIQKLSDLVASVLYETQIDAKYLQLEFTESVSIDYTEKVLEDIGDLKKLGIKLILDDFGTYYSSLAYLRQGVVDKLKIDQTFVQGINRGTSDVELIIAIINLAHSLKLNVVAEGVETQEQMLFLEQNHVDELQGYYLDRPMSGEACMNLLDEILVESEV